MQGVTKSCSVPVVLMHLPRGRWAEQGLVRCLSGRTVSDVKIEQRARTERWTRLHEAQVGLVDGSSSSVPKLGIASTSRRGVVGADAGFREGAMG